MERWTSLERTVWRAPLGLRFFDLARLTPVTDGLVVTASPLPPATANDAARVMSSLPVFQASRSPLSGIYGFRSLPGLRTFEFPDPTLPIPAGPAAEEEEPSGQDLLLIGNLRDLVDADETPVESPNFAVSIRDLYGRYLPQTHIMALPRRPVVETPLFSSPAREKPAGMALLLAELWQSSSTDEPTSASAEKAAWAYVTATIGGPPPEQPTFVGIADARGMVALFVPTASGPPQAVSIQVFWEPEALRWSSVARENDPPDLRSILEQRQASIVDKRGDPAIDSISRILEFGANLVVKTKGKQSSLLVTAAGP